MDETWAVEDDVALLLAASHELTDLRFDLAASAALHVGLRRAGMITRADRRAWWGGTRIAVVATSLASDDEARARLGPSARALLTRIQTRARRPRPSIGSCPLAVTLGVWEHLVERGEISFTTEEWKGFTIEDRARRAELLRRMVAFPDAREPDERISDILAILSAGALMTEGCGFGAPWQLHRAATEAARGDWVMTALHAAQPVDNAAVSQIMNNVTS